MRYGRYYLPYIATLYLFFPTSKVVSFTLTDGKKQRLINLPKNTHQSLASTAINMHVNSWLSEVHHTLPINICDRIDERRSAFFTVRGEERRVLRRESMKSG